MQATSDLQLGADGQVQNWNRAVCERKEAHESDHDDEDGEVKR